MTISKTLSAALSERGLDATQFSELMIRLFDKGVLCRDESGKGAELYDRYLQTADLVEEYLRVLHIRTLHEPHFRTLRLFPPGAEVPGLADDDSNTFGGLRARLNQQEVATILVLRAEYDKAVREGQLDERGEATLPIEALNLASRNLLNRSLPQARTEREALFRRLRQLRLIRGAADAALEDGEAWLTIRPDIMSIVTGAILAQLGEGLESPAPATDDED